jgi:hypothetical protein
MDFNNQTPSAADARAEAEATDILRNPDNKDHKIYWDPGHYNHQAVKERVESLFSRAYPGTTTLDDIDTGLQKAMAESLGLKTEVESKPAETPAKTPEAQPGEQTQISPEEAQIKQGADAAAQELLIKYGDQAGEMLSRAQNFSSYLETTSPVWPTIVMSAIKHGIPQHVIVEILAEAGVDYGFDGKR